MILLRHAAAGLAGALVCACQPLPIANQRNNNALENCQTESDQTEFVAALELGARGKHEEALPRLGALVPRNEDCARLPIEIRKLLSFLPEEERAKSLLSFYTQYRDLERERRQGGDRSANLAFAIALFCKEKSDQIDWLKRSVGRDDRHYYALTKLGERNWLDGELNLARERLTRAAALQKNLAEAWLILAVVEADSGNSASAARHYRSYLALRPFDRGVAKRYLRMLIQDLRDAKAASELVEKLHSADPSDPEVALDRAAVSWLLGKHGEAESQYKALLRKYPDDPRILLNLANLYYAPLAQPKKALQAYRLLLRMPVGTEASVLGDQLLFAYQRVHKLVKKLGDDAPAEPKSIDEIL